MDETIDCPYCGDIAYKQERIWNEKRGVWIQLYECVVCFLPCGKTVPEEEVRGEGAEGASLQSRV